jgi:acyl carrier protein
MMNEQKLGAVFERVFVSDGLYNVREFTYGDMPDGTKDWDSLQHMILCSLIEDEFYVMFRIDQIAKIRSYDDAKAVLSGLGVDFNV